MSLMERPLIENEAGLRVHASLLYVGPRPLAGPEMAESLTPLLSALGLPVTRRLSDGNTGLSLRTTGPEVLIHAKDAPLSERVLGRLKRPEGLNDPRLGRRLEQHAAHVTVRIADLPTDGDVCLTRAQRIALMQRIVRHLLTFAPAELVVWHPTDMLFTPDEFRRDGAPKPRKAAKTLPPIVEDDDLTNAHQIFETLDGKLKDIEQEVANSLPDLPTRLTDGNEKLREIFRVVQKNRPHREVLARMELSEPGGDDELVKKLSVYVMNGTIMVMSFPVGMGLLTFNILKGGDLKATARMMALTGTAIGFLTHLPGILPGI